MVNAPHYLLLVLVGIALISWGLPAAHRLTAPRDSLAALAVLAGTGLLLLGAVLTVLPRFFLE